ncbi:putative membrane protein DUF2157 [Thiogranum longum]|uniref:Putative membrane protein DUF2157 n=1 Tax=Thiogranum longum TaxID=1537524 RepID=A0A4R1HC98_9GAMM|nr:DUF2157 domain-containing protein [Thiogranum longum]TCK18241.1 putative membrane protein DUF2157 [Thiogranum longum]
MEPGSKAQAQQRADQIRSFQAELSRLEAEGVVRLSTDQQGAISRYHGALLADFSQAFDIDRNRQAMQLSLGMRIASFLGALALAASVFFLFYQFWGGFGSTTQVSILVLASLASFSATGLITRVDESGYFVKLAAMVAFACFVLNVFMLGQIFNITPSDNALLVWAAFALLLAYALDVRLLLAAGIFCLIGYLSARTGTWGGGYWLHFGERPENFLPAGLLLFFFPALVDHRRLSGFGPIYRVFGLLTVLLPVLILANWGDGSYLVAGRDLIEAGYQVAGFVISALAIWYGIRRHHPEVTNTGNVFFVIFLYTKFFDWWWESMPKYLFFLIIGLTAMLFLVIFKRLRGSANVEDGEVTHG